MHIVTLNETLLAGLQPQHTLIASMQPQKDHTRGVAFLCERIRDRANTARPKQAACTTQSGHLLPAKLIGLSWLTALLAAIRLERTRWSWFCPANRHLTF